MAKTFTLHAKGKTKSGELVEVSTDCTPDFIKYEDNRPVFHDNEKRETATALAKQKLEESSQEEILDITYEIVES